jgi:hypothetical protein
MYAYLREKLGGDIRASYGKDTVRDRSFISQSRADILRPQHPLRISRARGGTSEGILKATRSAATTRHKPVARVRKTRTNSKPREVGRGAERLVTPNTQGIYHQSLDLVSSRGGRWKLRMDS